MCWRGLTRSLCRDTNAIFANTTSSQVRNLAEQHVKTVHRVQSSLPDFVNETPLYHFPSSTTTCGKCELLCRDDGQLSLHACNEKKWFGCFIKFSILFAFSKTFIGPKKIPGLVCLTRLCLLCTCRKARNGNSQIRTQNKQSLFILFIHSFER